MNVREIILNMTACVCFVIVSINTCAIAEQTAGSTDKRSDGVVRKIDKEAGKITLKHGPIKDLDMPGMTMVFRIENKSMLDSIQTGDKVKFKAVSDGGKIVITDIQVDEPQTK
jgi:Cu/Ag efflux protein CusF